MLAFPKVFFELQLNFADQVAPHFGITFQQALFKYTSFYNRIIGFDAQHTPQMSHPGWVTFIDGLPDNRESQTNYVFNRYQASEESPKTPTTDQKYGCFWYTYHADKNRYELHFTNADPEGNLGQDRVQARMNDLKALTVALQGEMVPNATIYLYSWLLNIEAFQRLMPPTLVNQTKVYIQDEAQSNAHWGQFVDRHGGLQTDLANKLLANAKQRFEQINYYFPLKCLQVELPVTEFTAFYLT